MKKIFLLWMCLALVSMLCTSVVFAEEVGETAVVENETTVPGAETEIDSAPNDSAEMSSEIVPEETPPMTQEQIQEVGEKAYSTIFTRVFEFVELRQDRIIMLFGFVGTALITMRDIRRKKSFDRVSDSKQMLILSGVEGVTTSQNGVIDAVNHFTLEFEDLKRKCEELASAEDDRNKLAVANSVQTAVILDILSNVYTHSTLPQGVKDLVALLYARCQTALDGDEFLKSRVSVIHELINKKENAPAETEVT